MIIEEEKIIDMHTHAWNNLKISKEVSLDNKNFIEDLEKLSDQAKKSNNELCLVYLTYPRLLLDDQKFSALKTAVHSENKLSNLRFGTCIDPEENEYELILKRAKEINFRCLKFSIYEQNICENNFHNIGKIAKRAEELGFFISVCCTYGSKKIYINDGIKLVIYLTDLIQCPIIMAHAGGSRVFDAMSVALDCPNIYMDLAFTLEYWKGSSVPNDLAFAIRKVGVDKFFFGSDYPFVPFEKAQKTTLDFLNENNFSDKEIQSIFYENAKKFLNVWFENGNKNN